MLILTRRNNQSIIIGNDPITTVTVLNIKDKKVVLGVHAHKDTPILRAELHPLLLQHSLEISDCYNKNKHPQTVSPLTLDDILEINDKRIDNGNHK